jgi:hypothetical protein
MAHPTYWLPPFPDQPFTHVHAHTHTYSRAYPPASLRLRTQRCEQGRFVHIKGTESSWVRGFHEGGQGPAHGVSKRKAA